MLLKNFVFSIFALFVMVGPLKAEETQVSTNETMHDAVAPHMKHASMTEEQKEEIRSEHKAKREAWVKAHPEQLKHMQENRAKRQQWMKEHPQEAIKMKAEMEAKKAARKAKMQESQASQ